MGIAQALISQIAATDAITSIVGSRVYPSTVRLADKQYPLIAYKSDNTTSIQSYSGPANPLRSGNIALACIGQTYADADNLAAAVLAAFDGQGGTWGTTTVQGCFLQDDGVTDDVVTQEETEEIIYFVKEVTFLVWYIQ